MLNAVVCYFCGVDSSNYKIQGYKLLRGELSAIWFTDSYYWSGVGLRGPRPEALARAQKDVQFFIRAVARFSVYGGVHPLAYIWRRTFSGYRFFSGAPLGISRLKCQKIKDPNPKSKNSLNSSNSQKQGILLTTYDEAGGH
jgi:hypothetical protein